MAQPPREMTTSILEPVSAVSEAAVETLPPLSNTTEADGLEAFIPDNPVYDVTITFAYAGLRVLVHSLFHPTIVPLKTTIPTVPLTLLRRLRIVGGIDGHRWFESSP